MTNRPTEPRASRPSLTSIGVALAICVILLALTGFAAIMMAGTDSALLPLPPLVASLCLIFGASLCIGSGMRGSRSGTSIADQVGRAAQQAALARILRRTGIACLVLIVLATVIAALTTSMVAASILLGFVAVQASVALIATASFIAR